MKALVLGTMMNKWGWSSYRVASITRVRAIRTGSAWEPWGAVREIDRISLTLRAFDTDSSSLELIFLRVYE